MQHQADVSPIPTPTLEARGNGHQRGGNHFRRQHRLVKHQVVALLDRGARFGRAELGLKFSENSFGQGRIAIAIPKRMLKFAVDRNRVKRVIREQFRQHQVRACPVDVLVTLQRQMTTKKKQPRINKSERGRLRVTFAQLLRDVLQRFGAAT